MTDRRLLNQLYKSLNRLPRVQLGYYPTPLEKLPRLSKALGGPTIYFKRDDLTGPAFGSNKSRMFEYLLGHVLRNTKHDCIVAGAAVQSTTAVNSPLPAPSSASRFISCSVRFARRMAGSWREIF